MGSRSCHERAKKSRLFTKLVTEIALCWEFESLGARELVDSLALKKASLFTKLVTEIVPFRIPGVCHRTDLKVHRSKKLHCSQNL